MTRLLIYVAGIAGLLAGCYAQINGYRSRIFELHTLPGGLCAAWRRKGCLFDGAFRYLTGAGPKNNAHIIWKELGMLEGRRFHFCDEFTRYEAADGCALLHIIGGDGPPGRLYGPVCGASYQYHYHRP